MTRTNELALRMGWAVLAGVGLGIASDWLVGSNSMPVAWAFAILGVLIANWLISRYVGRPDAVAFTAQLGTFLVAYIGTIIATGAGP